MDMLGNVQRFFERCMGEILGKEMQKEDCRSSVMKRSCVWQTHGCMNRIGKLPIVQLDVKQKLILCLWGKIQKVCRGYESDFMETSTQAGGWRSE